MTDLQDDPRMDALEAEMRRLDDDRTEGLMDKLEGKTSFRVSEVAELLDYSEETIRRKLRSGDLPGVKLGKSWRVSREALEEWWREEGGGELFAEEEA